MRDTQGSTKKAVCARPCSCRSMSSAGLSPRVQMRGATCSATDPAEFYHDLQMTSDVAAGLSSA